MEALLTSQSNTLPILQGDRYASDNFIPIRSTVWGVESESALNSDIQGQWHSHTGGNLGY